MSIQRERLYEVLKDMKPHRTDSLVAAVYSPGAALARLAGRVFEVKQRLPSGWSIKSWKAPENPVLHYYQLCRPVEAQGSLFGEAV